MIRIVYPFILSAFLISDHRREILFDLRCYDMFRHTLLLFPLVSSPCFSSPLPSSRTPFSPLFFSLFNWSSIHQLFMEACAKCSFFKWGAWIFIILGTMLYFSFHMVFEMFIMLPFGKKDLFIDVIKSSITLGSHNHNQHQ